jgi:hypothetical protein
VEANKLSRKFPNLIPEILDPTYNPTGGVKLVSPGDLEVLDPQPYND